MERVVQERHLEAISHVLDVADNILWELDEEQEQEDRRQQGRRSHSRSCWIKKYRTTRLPTGNVQHLMRELQPGSSDFRNFIRMDETCFERILSNIRQQITKQDTNMRLAIPAHEKLAVTLRFLATGESFLSLDYSTKLSKSFLAQNIIEVCDAIYNNLKTDFLKVKLFIYVSIKEYI